MLAKSCEDEARSEKSLVVEAKVAKRLVDDAEVAKKLVVVAPVRVSTEKIDDEAAFNIWNARPFAGDVWMVVVPCPYTVRSAPDEGVVVPMPTPI